MPCMKKNFKVLDWSRQKNKNIKSKIKIKISSVGDVIRGTFDAAATDNCILTRLPSTQDDMMACYFLCGQELTNDQNDNLPLSAIWVIHFPYLSS